MNNHNTHFYSKEEVERTLKSTEEFEDGEQLFYFIGTLRYLYDDNIEKDKEIERLNKEKDDLDDYNRHLYNENKRLNNIIEELKKDLTNILEDMYISLVYIDGRGYYSASLIPLEDEIDKLKSLKEGK